MDESEILKIEQREAWRDVLERAADLIERRGLNKGGYSGDDGSLCVFGAINMAVSGKPNAASYTPHPAAVVVQQSLWSEPLERCSITRYNDHPETTGAMVVTKLREVARS